MAEKNSSYPVIPGRHWWTLRKKFRQSLPTSLTPKSLMISLGIKEEKTAKVNVYDQLIKLGLIDKDGKINNDLANRWREDEHYTNVCEQIRKRIYPKELLETASDPTVNREGIARWFRINAGVGASVANKMAAVYRLLAEGNPSKGEDTGTHLKIVGDRINRSSSQEKKPSGKTRKQSSGSEARILTEPSLLNEPSIHIDIQIHISPEASAEQIEQVFANMAKYLYPKHK